MALYNMFIIIIIIIIIIIYYYYYYYFGLRKLAVACTQTSKGGKTSMLETIRVTI